MCFHCCTSAPQVGKFSFMANSRARSVDDTEGMVKFIADSQTDKILGVTIMGPNAGASFVYATIGDGGASFLRSHCARGSIVFLDTNPGQAKA